MEPGRKGAHGKDKGVCSVCFCSCVVLSVKRKSRQLWSCAPVCPVPASLLWVTLTPHCRLRCLVECRLGAGCRGAGRGGQSSEAQAEAWEVSRFKAGCAFLVFWERTLSQTP